MTKTTKTIKEAATPVAASAVSLQDAAKENTLLLHGFSQDTLAEADSPIAPVVTIEQLQLQLAEQQREIQRLRSVNAQTTSQYVSIGARCDKLQREKLQIERERRELEIVTRQLTAKVIRLEPILTPAPAAPLDEHAETRELLRRFKLPQAWQDGSGQYYFDEKAAQAAQATTVVTPEV
ncbi:hypothetical protein [Hymenobacter fodinae]|uniref:Uncharacterized protein n=1 Tax=Hymenobacter fodinae TaxID=2510796 RepID=A0A4Z0P758_9BACT|nr:hypothetical protein [Hymenobacter fodinae]TGE08254.1 hypothetical protein EU556_11060 [Hymenobacter fodinae]